MARDRQVCLTEAGECADQILNRLHTLSTGHYCASAVESEDLGVESECISSTNLKLKCHAKDWIVLCYTAAGLHSPQVNTDGIYLSREKGLVSLNSAPTKLILSTLRRLIKNVLMNILVSGDWLL